MKASLTKIFHINHISQTTWSKGDVNCWLNFFVMRHHPAKMEAKFNMDVCYLYSKVLPKHLTMLKCFSKVKAIPRQWHCIVTIKNIHLPWDVKNTPKLIKKNLLQKLISYIPYVWDSSYSQTVHVISRTK